MRGALAIAVAGGLGGCQLVLSIEDYPPTLGEPCSINAVCGEGEVCDFASGAGPMCIEAQGDIDSDGIPDELDHCLHVTGGAHDEDNDGMGDECDRCPIAPPPSQPDSDDDEVDAPCDPHRSTTGDRIAFFDGFNGSVLGAAWRPATASSWQIRSGALRYNGDARAGLELIEASFVMSGTVALQTGYRVSSLSTSDVIHRVVMGAEDPSPAAGDARIECTTERADGDPDKVAISASGYASMPPPTGVDLFSTDQQHRIAGLRQLASGSCVFLEGDTPAGGTQASVLSGQLGTMWLGGQATNVDFEWVLVVVQ